MGKTDAIRQADRFFSGKTCVVTGRPTHNHWHHLDENHDNWVPANIVPVEPNINHDIEQLRKSLSAPMSKEITCANLEAVAREHYDLGRFAESYGCSRLASFIAASYGSDPDLSVQFATEALHSLRPLADTNCAAAFAVDTLQRNIVPMIRRAARRRQLRSETSLALCREITSYCLDHGEIAYFERWMSLADAMVGQQADYPPTFELLCSRLAQHRAFAVLATETRPAIRERARRELNNISKFMTNRRYTFGVSTIAQHLALAYAVDGKTDEADRILRATDVRLGSIEPICCANSQRHLGAYSWWTYARLLLTRADVLLLRKKTNEAHAHVDSALRIIEGRRIRALGTTPFHSLQDFHSVYPNDSRLPTSQTGGPASRAYLICAARVLRTLQDFYRLVR